MLTSGRLAGALLAASCIRIASAGYPTGNAIQRDYVIVGGGSGGTYAAVALHKLGKSFVVIEKEDRLGGHTQTYHDQATGLTYDYGVQIFDNISIVTDYFGYFNIPLTTVTFSESSLPDYVDFKTGLVNSNVSTANPQTALGTYASVIAQFPYLGFGYNLPTPVPADLTLPFGQFIKKYNIQDAVLTIAGICEGIGNILKVPTIYVFKYFSQTVLAGEETGFLTTAHHDNSALYEAAQTLLGDNVLLSSNVTQSTRTAKGNATLIVQTPSGVQTIVAGTVILAVPQTVRNLAAFNLDQKEKSVFSKFETIFYYTALVNETGLPDDVAITNAGANVPYNLLSLPGPYGISATGIPGIQSIFYSSLTYMSDHAVKQDITANILRLKNAGYNTTAPNFVEFSSHSPFQLQVSGSAIDAGFYDDLNALQGYRNTYYTGAAFQAQDSSMIWNFTQSLIDKITA